MACYERDDVMKIEFTRDEVMNMIEKHVLEDLELPFDNQVQTIKIEIGGTYSSVAAVVTIISKEKDTE